MASVLTFTTDLLWPETAFSWNPLGGKLSSSEVQHKFWPCWVVLAPNFIYFFKNIHRIGLLIVQLDPPFPKFPCVWDFLHIYVILEFAMAWGTASEIAFFSLHLDDLCEGNSCDLDMTKCMDWENLVPWIFTWKLLRKENRLVDITTSGSLVLCVSIPNISCGIFIIDYIDERYFLFD